MTPASPATFGADGRVDVNLTYTLAEEDIGGVVIAAVPLRNGEQPITPIDGQDILKIVYEFYRPTEMQGSRTLSFYPNDTPGAFDETVNIDQVELVIQRTDGTGEYLHREEVDVDYTFEFEPVEEGDFRITHLEAPLPNYRKK